MILTYFAQNLQRNKKENVFIMFGRVSGYISRINVRKAGPITSVAFFIGVFSSRGLQMKVQKLKIAIATAAAMWWKSLPIWKQKLIMNHRAYRRKERHPALTFWCTHKSQTSWPLPWQVTVEAGIGYQGHKTSSCKVLESGPIVCLCKWLIKSNFKYSRNFSHITIQYREMLSLWQLTTMCILNWFSWISHMKKLRLTHVLAYCVLWTQFI